MYGHKSFGLPPAPGGMHFSAYWFSLTHGLGADGAAPQPVSSYQLSEPWRPEWRQPSYAKEVRHICQGKPRVRIAGRSMIGKPLS